MQKDCRRKRILKIDFIKRLSHSFKGGNDIIYEDLNDWIERCQIGAKELTSLYEEIKENYTSNTFPTLAKIIKYWENIYKEPVKENVSPIIRYRKFVQGWDVKKIILNIQELRKKEELQPHEIDMIHQWSDLHSEFGILKDTGVSGEEMKLHLQEVKSATIAGKSFDSAFKRPAKVEIDHKRAWKVQAFDDIPIRKML